VALIIVSVFTLFTTVSGPTVAAETLFPEGSLWQVAGDSRVYVISKQRKRHIPNEAIFNSYGFRFADVRLLDRAAFDALPQTRVIKLANSPAVFSITSGQRIAITSAADFLAQGFAWDEIAILNQLELTWYDAPGSQTPPPQSVHPLLDKVSEARALLHAAAPVYLQEKQAGIARTLTAGVSGSDVEAVQRILQTLGYFPKTITPNGIFGPATEAAVLAFQKAVAIEQVGTVGPKTLAALEQRGLPVVGSGSLVRQWTDTVPADREVLLAAWHEQNNEMRLVQVVLTTERVASGGSIRTVPKAVSRTPGFNVRYDSGNGVNVQYTVTSPTGYKVLANRFPIFDAPPGSLGTFPPTEEVYVPFNTAFLDPVIVASGRSYLDSVVTQATTELRQLGVRSRSHNGLVADFADPNLLKAIALIEHMDTTEFVNASNKDAVVNKVFAILATNREDSYQFSGSSAGAFGLAQFISSTYSGITRLYPSAKLIPDFRSGMVNHVNGFKAMALYHDANAASLESSVQQYITSNPELFNVVVAEALAAAYNGGPGRIRLAISRFGNAWQTTVNSTYGLRTETRSYIQKFRAVQQWLVS